MSEADVPSVPITTLAGLTSLSDLLSELPVSDSISSITSLNKSLLFHTLVAEESDNLLSVRDDNLVRQLVHAIEQTNSDHIELKSRFAVNQPGTNISEYPELLQGIYTFRPTVFNTPQNQRPQNSPFSVNLNQLQPHNQQQQQTQQPQQQQQQISLQQQQLHPNNKLNTIPVNQNDLSPQATTAQSNTITLRNKVQFGAPQNLSNNNSNIQYTGGGNKVLTQTQNIIVSNNAANITQSLESPSNRKHTNKLQVPPDSSVQQKQELITLQQENQLQQHHLLLQQQQQELIQQQNLQQQQHQLHSQSHIVQHTSIVQQVVPVQTAQQLQLQQSAVGQMHTENFEAMQINSLPAQSGIKANNFPQGTSAQQVLQIVSIPHHSPQNQTTQQSNIMQQTITNQTSYEQPNQQRGQTGPGLHFPARNLPGQVKTNSQSPQHSKTPLQHQHDTFSQQHQQSTLHDKHAIGYSLAQHDNPHTNTFMHPHNTHQTKFVLNQQQSGLPLQQQNVIGQQNVAFDQRRTVNVIQQQEVMQACKQTSSNLTSKNHPEVQMQMHTILQKVAQHRAVNHQSPTSEQLQQPHAQKTNSSTQQQKSIPRNNEYLEQQNKNLNRIGSSPDQGNVAPESIQIGISKHEESFERKMHGCIQSPSTMINKDGLQPRNEHNNSNFALSSGRNSRSSADSGSLLLPKVCLSRLKAEDEVLMQQSLKQFAKKSPELAKKLGLSDVAPETTDTPEIQNMEFNTLTSEKNVTKSEDMFSKMKADETRLALKRKLAVSNQNIPPEEIFSKPKLRKVSKSLAVILPRSSREEILKMQTYQQFMKNMDQIIEQLDDTEQPNLNSDETDEAIECITSKMLTVVSNDVAKLKAKGVLDAIPKNKLTLLINYAMRNVYLARNYAAGPDVDEEFATDDLMDKILNATEACLLICNIYSTVKDLKFLQEDNISLIVKFVQFQLRETIFPSYDPVYSVKNLKKIDNRKKKLPSNQNRCLQLLYSKIVELMKVFVTLFDKCVFVDTIVLALSTLAVEPFFVDNIETLQFICLELVTTLFRKENYVQMRRSILNDILASVDKLPCSKKNLRPFKLANNSGNIQMVTALILQLIQCATVLPETICEQSAKYKKYKAPSESTEENLNENFNKPDKDLIVIEKYDTAVSIGGNFLTTFLSKCKTRSSETDFRPLFENFIHDLLATVNKPEWPASELLLSLLGTLLVKYMSDRTIEQSIRLASLDYLGIVAARLRKDTVESRCKVNTMDQMIKCIKAEQEKEGEILNKNSKIVLDPEEERTEFLQKMLLDFLAVNAQDENLIWGYARHFYLAQWYRDILQQRKRIAEGEKGYASRRKTKKKRKKGDSSGSSSEEDDGKSEEEGKDSARNETTNSLPDHELNLEIFHILDERKKYLLNKIRPYDINCTSQHMRTYIDYNNAHLIAQYLASKRPFSQSFDKYLQKIILVVREPAIAIRTRAMKCLTSIVEVDPLILRRKDMQMGVNQKFLDTAISVREAAVDLIGKYVLSSEDLIDQYYEMLSTRILDTGVSVRKRVIKILRDICLEYPDFDKIPEICVKMIRRVNDEEGIQKLVTEVFMKMWFTPCRENDKAAIHRKITQIVDVVNTAHDTGTMWLDGLLTTIFAPKDANKLNCDGSSGEVVKRNTEPPAEVVLSCQQLADGLVERLIQLEDTDNSRMLGCITTIHLLAKVRPQLLVRHAITIEPYLNIKCHATTAPKFISSVAEILEQVVPLMEHPSDSFLADLEEHLMVLVVSLNQTVVLSCLSCLGAVVNKITKNYKLIRDCFAKFYKSIALSKEQLINNPNLPLESIYQPIFRRSLYTIGILMRFFDFTSSTVLGLEDGDGLSATICDDVFDCIMYFMTCTNFDIRKQALVSLGHFCVQNDQYLTRQELRDYYRELLRCPSVEPHIKLICMRNIWMYLTESELYMHNKEKDWHTQAQLEDLKEMNDVSSGMASRIIQLYLTEILNCFLHSDFSVRLWAVKVIQIVLRQGLVHPVRMVPYLICLSTDDKQEVAHRADALLKDIDKTYSGYVNMKLQQGLHLSFELQAILQVNENNCVIRGYTMRDDQMVSLNDFLYSLLRGTKPQRRALIQTFTKQFDDQKTTLQNMLYLADNLAYFPYVVQDEPLYLIHQIDIMISVTGTNLLAIFKEGLKPLDEFNQKNHPLEDDDDDEDKDLLYSRLPEDTTDLQHCITSAQGCMLMLMLKQHLKDMYGITDGKISRYSPSEPQKIYEKALNRKVVPKFEPKSIIEIIRKKDVICPVLDEKGKRDLIDKYLNFKQLMLKLDPDDTDTGDEDKIKTNTSLSTPSSKAFHHAEGFVAVATGKTGSQPGKNSSLPVNNVNNKVSNVNINQVKAFTQTPTLNSSATRHYKSATKTSSSRKQPARSKRKKKKLVVSSDEGESDFSDYSYD